MFPVTDFIKTDTNMFRNDFTCYLNGHTKLSCMNRQGEVTWNFRQIRLIDWDSYFPVGRDDTTRPRCQIYLLVEFWYGVFDLLVKQNEKLTSVWDLNNMSPITSFLLEILFYSTCIPGHMEFHFVFLSRDNSNIKIHISNKSSDTTDGRTQ